MVSVNRRTLYGEVFNDVRCLSSDEKPTEGIKNGSTLIEIDTGKRYLYDALSASWNEFSQGGGGGGSYVLPTMSQSVKGGATLGEGLSMSGDSLSVDYSNVASKQSLDDATKVDPDGGLKRTTDGLSADYTKVASVESLESATKLEADGGIKRTSNGLSVDYSEVASVEALEGATALSPMGGIVSTQDGLAISSEQSSTGAIDGALLELTAKSKPATQQTTTGKNLLDESKIESGTVINTGNSDTASNNRYRTSVNGGSILVSAGNAITVSGAVSGGTLNIFVSVYNVLPASNTARINDSGWLESGQSYTIPEGGQYIRLTLRRSDDANVSLSDFSNLQVELGSTATPYEPYTGGAPSPSPDYPQEIVTVRGRNLLDESSVINDYYINDSGVATYNSAAKYYDKYIKASGILTLQYYKPPTTSNAGTVITYYDDSKSFVSREILTTGTTSESNFSKSFDVPGNATYLRIHTSIASENVQLTEGSTIQPYVPYGYVGLERRDLQGTLLDTTPIPLPSRGWVAGLPDGTADELSVDGAGKVVWGLGTEEVVFDGSSDENWSRDNNRIFLRGVFYDKPGRTIRFYISHFICLFNGEPYDTSWDGVAYNGVDGALFLQRERIFTSLADAKAWLASNPVTVLYPLATPVTEDCGYIDLPDTQDCVLSIPELDALGVRYTIGDGAEIARQWYARAMSELEETQDAIVDLAAEVTTHEGRITVTENRLDALQSLRKGVDGYYVNETVTSWLARKFDGKIYGYSEPKTTATAVTKTGANAGLPNPTLGTLTERGDSVYRDIGPTQWYAAKGYVDSDGVPHVKVIRGVDSQEEWDACTDNVWSLRPVVYYSVDESGVSVNGQLSDTWHAGMKPNPRAYLPDGTMRPYMLAARHALAFEGGVGVSKPGLKGYGRNVSHNSLITLLDYANTGYSGKTEYEEWYENFMLRIIYGTKDSQGVMKGCTAYDLHYHPTVAETGVKRVILSNANAANLLLGSTVMMGNQATTSSDRNNVNCYNVFDGLVISSIETYDSANKAVYFDTEDTFDTDPAYLLSTAPWHTGSCGDMDWDGTPTAAGKTSGKEPMLFQGCELMNGNYEVLGDVILSSDGETGWIPYVNEDTKNESTSVTSDYVSCVTSLPVDDSDSWKYPLYLSERNGLMYGIQTGGSQTVGICDGHYTNKRATTGLREWLSLGGLSSGGHAGLASVSGYIDVGATGWGVWSRLSGVGRSKLSA